MTDQPSDVDHDEGRRDFLYVAMGAFAAVGTAAAIWPFINSMNPSADVLALSTTEVDLTAIEEGQAVTVIWRGSPVFVRRRTAEEIRLAREGDEADLPDSQPDEARVIEPEWLVVVGVCTHLGCIPQGQKVGEPRGEFGGWFCPCHGSHYDTSGRIRKGPAPRNLDVPQYTFLSENQLLIG
ncbi:MAG: ubiquinol-cytochrome c reductase iron-sulfur subunit [Alphaproteobacteria bacterium]